MVHRFYVHLTVVIFAATVLAACGSAPAGRSEFPGYVGEYWISSWTASAQETSTNQSSPARPGLISSFEDQTIRMIAHVSAGGSAARVELSNTFGDRIVKVGEARIALHEEDSSISAGTDHALTFAGNPSVLIPVGATIVSDPVEMSVPAMGHLAVSLYFPEATGPPTRHSVGLHPAYIAAGNHTGQVGFEADRVTNGLYFLSAVDVRADEDAGTIVAFGDSITDGVGSSQNADHDWPSLLASRLQEAGIKDLAVTNEGISGNRVLRDGAGPNALSRFDRDVLSIPGARYLIVMEGINDIGQGLREGANPANAVTAEDLIAAHTQLVERAHEHGIKAIGATLTPYNGAGYYSPAGEEIRLAFNQWIRTAGVYDAVLDFEKAVRDPADPSRIRSDFTRDNLHPNDAGYEAMVASIDLRVFDVRQLPH
jgi:lysophospholipase L1-like esterase